MNPTVQLLQDAARNTRTGESAVEQLLNHAHGEAIRRELERERAEYAKLAEAVRAQLAQAGGAPEPVGLLARAGMWAGIEMKTMADEGDSHLAELLIQGATMGITEMTKARNSYPNADPEALGLAGEFIKNQQDAIERLKGMLENRE